MKATTLAIGVAIPLNIFNRQQYAIPMVQQQQILLNQQQQRGEATNTRYCQQHQLKVYVASSMPQQHKLLWRPKFRAVLLGFQQGNCPLPTFSKQPQLQNLRLGQLQTLRQAANCPSS